MNYNKNYYIRQNKKLKKELDEWKYQLAYYTEEDIPTPKGVKSFIIKILVQSGELTGKIHELLKY